MGEEDKCEKCKLYLESLLFQARDDAGLDWHDGDKPVSSVWIKNVLKTELRELEWWRFCLFVCFLKRIKMTPSSSLE